MFKIMQSVFFLWVGKHFPIASLVGDIGWVPAEYTVIFTTLLSGGLKLAPMILID